MRYAKAACPVEFRRYMLEGDHWRAGRRIQGEVAKFSGLQLHRATPGTDGQEGAHQFTGAFLAFLEAARVEEEVKRRRRTIAADLLRIETAIGAVEVDQPESVAALRYYVVPEGRRGQLVYQAASALDMSADAFRRAAVRAVVLVWDEMGGVWSGWQASDRTRIDVG